MTSRLRASVLSAALLLLAAPLHAASLRADVPVVGAPSAAALTFVRSHLPDFGVRQAQLAVIGETALVGGHVLRIGQIGPGGLPVLDAEVAVVVMKGRLIAATGQLRRISSFAGAATIDRSAALAALVAFNKTARVAGAQLALQVRGGHAQAVWVLPATTQAPWNSWKVLVDARSGQVLYGLSTRRHARAQGLAYLPSPAKSGVKQVTLERLTATHELIGAYADVQSCGYEGNTLTCTRRASTLRNNDYLLATPDEPSVEDAFSEVHMYYHVDTFHRWLKDSFGFKRKAGQQIKVFVNFYTLNSSGKKRGMANAFFGDVTGDGKGDLVFGQSTRDFAYDGDVVYHEFAHSAIDETSNLEPNFDDLGYNSFPLALNEAFADLISSVFTGDGDVGEYAGGDYTTGAIRSLDGKTLSCADDLIAESHHDGLIWGRFVWALRGKVPSTRLFDQVLYKTMVGLSKNAGFSDAAKLLSSIATATDPALGKRVDAEIEARGLLTECNRVIPLAENTPRGGYMLGTSSVMGITYVPAGLQYRIDVPVDAKTVTIRVEGGGHGGDTSTFIGAFIRKAATVSFTGQEPQRDFTMQNTETEFVLERDGKNLLVPGASYYVLPLNVSQYELGYQISVTIERAPLSSDAGPSKPDAGADLAAPDSSSTSNNATGGGGCAIATGSPRATLGLSLLLLGLLALRRSRRQDR